MSSSFRTRRADVSQPARIAPPGAYPILLAWLVASVAGHAESADGPDNPAGPAVVDRQLQEVTVTANRRQESNQRVPSGVTAISADLAEKVGATDTQSLAPLVPGLLFNRQANASIPFLRGVGNPMG